MREQSVGEYRVGIGFNPSKNSKVDEIKKASASLIDLCDSFRSGNPEVERLLTLAQTHFEDAAMWAVKAVTKESHG